MVLLGSILLCLQQLAAMMDVCCHVIAPTITVIMVYVCVPGMNVVYFFCVLTTHLLLVYDVGVFWYYYTGDRSRGGSGVRNSAQCVL